MPQKRIGRQASQLEENLKKAITEFLMLHLLSERDFYIKELADTLRERSAGALAVVFPYSVIYRLLDDGCIQELPKRMAPDGRKRQYYAITPKGEQYHRELWEVYANVTKGVATVLNLEQADV